MVAISPDNCRIAHDVIGDGPPLVLLHGFTETRESWIEFGHAGRLVASRRLILIDARGHGASDKPHAPEAYSPSRRAADVIAVLDSLGIGTADLMGYSMGAMIALAVALKHPDRVGRLVTIAAHPFGQDMAPFREALGIGIESWLSWIETEAGPVSDAMRTRIRANDLRALRACVAEDRPDASAALAALKAPLLAIAGTADPAFDQVRRFADLAGGEFVALPKRNHFNAFLAADEIAAAVTRFLTRPDTSARPTAA